MGLLLTLAFAVAMIVVLPVDDCLSSGGQSPDPRSEVTLLEPKEDTTMSSSSDGQKSEKQMWGMDYGGGMGMGGGYDYGGPYDYWYGWGGGWNGGFSQRELWRRRRWCLANCMAYGMRGCYSICRYYSILYKK